MYVSAKEFCQHTGFPARTLARYLREGLLDYHKAGRRYVLDKEQTLERLRILAKHPSDTPVVRRKNKVRNSRIKGSSDIFNGAEDYKERISRLKNDISRK